MVSSLIQWSSVETSKGFTGLSSRNTARRSNPVASSVTSAPYTEEFPVRNAAGRYQANTQDFRGQASTQDSQSLARRANLAAPTTISGPYDEEAANRRSPGISQADMRDPQYSYMSSVYGQGADGDTGVTGRNQGFTEKRDGNMGTVGNIESYPRRQAPYSPAGRHDSGIGPQHTGLDLTRRRSIPRKEVGTGLTSSPIAGSSSSPPQVSMNPKQHSSVQKPLPTPPNEPLVFGGQRSSTGHSARSSSVGQAPPPEEVVQRAKSSTYDTEIIERVAPG